MSVREAPSEWHKSSFSQNGDCIECAYDKEYIYIRDSKSAHEGALQFTYSEWQAFIAGVKSGEADLDAEVDRQMQGSQLSA